MIYKMLATLFLFAIVLVMPIYASEAPEPGITPDNVILWKFDGWMEKSLIALTFDPEEKIHKSLRAAEERITEMEKMLRKEKKDSAQKALDAHNDAIENIRSYIIYLNYQEKEKEFEKEFVIESLLIEYDAIFQLVYNQLQSEDIKGEEKAFALDAFAQMKIQEQILIEELEKKKEDTRMKIRANGLNEDQLAALENVFSIGNASMIRELSQENYTENETNIAHILTENKDIIKDTMNTTVENIGYIIGYLSNSSSNASMINASMTTVITDTSTRSKVAIEGDMTTSQMDYVSAIYDTLVSGATNAEIEIIVTEVQQGAWRIEKEVDGLLTEEQRSLLDTLLLSLSADPHAVRIKIKYHPDRQSYTEVYTGTSSEKEVSTNFVIG